MEVGKWARGLQSPKTGRHFDRSVAQGEMTVKTDFAIPVGQWEGDFIRYSTPFHFSTFHFPTTTKNAVLWRCVV